MSFGGLAREGLPAGDARANDLDEVLKAADRGASLTKQLLIFSRQEPSEKRPTDLNENLAQIGKFLARAVGDNVRLRVMPCAHPVVVAIDPVRFDQILLNLAVNARDAMPGGGLLELALTGATEPGQNPMARLTVSDTGVGMTDETKQRIFEPFFTTKERGKGSGLGLATCFGIVADAGGTIRVTSVIGKGTTFVIELPLCSTAVATDQHLPGIRVPGRGERVLVVEDEPALRQAMLRVLQTAGYTVVAAADGEEALARISAPGADLDLVISDVVMPGRSGHDVEQHCARISPRTAVILTSGHLEEAPQRPRPDGAAILRKPVPTDELLRAVAQALARRTASTLPETSRDPVEPGAGIVAPSRDAPTPGAL
jgi:CheY-like chemotaxis protein